MPCMMHGLMRKRGIVVVGGMERFKSGHLDIVVAGVVIGLRSADANGCVDAREHHFKLNVAGFGIGDDRGGRGIFAVQRSEEHTSELQSLMRTSYAVFCLKKKKTKETIKYNLKKLEPYETYSHDST